MTNDQAENALIAFVIVLAVLCLMCGVAWAGCGMNQREEITSGDAVTMNICASVEASCVMGDKHVPCADVPVFPLTEADLTAAPVTPQEQWAASVAWKKAGTP